MRTSLDRFANRLVLAVIPMLVVALVCAVAHLYVPASAKIRNLSLDFIPTAAIDTSSTAVGIADSDLYFMSAADVATTLDVMQAMGVNQVRVFVPWAAVEAKADVYDWSKVDMVINAAAQRGMAVLAAVTSTPKWAGGTTYAPNTAPNSTAAYAQFMGDLATRYGAATNGGEAKISAYEVWNEPNGFAGWAPSPSAKAYTELLKAAYTAIKAADPTTTVVGGVLGAGLSFGSLTVNPVTFLQQMYANGAEGYFDALSLHPYQNKTKFSAGYNANYPLQQLQAMRNLMNANGDGDKLIWNTEYGLPTSVVSEVTQAAFVQDLLNTWSGLTGVGPMFFYTTRDREANSNDSEDNFGLFYNNWTPKKVVQVIAE
ncbi:MAG TPA: cellulase family glycosylhydrolase, partial [Mycobacterium sp.]